MDVFWTVLITLGIVATCAAMHFQVLVALPPLLRRVTRMKAHTRMAIGLMIAFVSHIVHIAIFALVYRILHDTEFGRLEGSHNGTYMEMMYYSCSVYSTLGFGDIVPTGHLRMLTAFESLTGLVLIAWTASFLFLYMQKLAHLD